MLGDPLLQKFLQLRPSAQATRRLHFWLESFFDEELEAAREQEPERGNLDRLLDAVLGYVRFTKVSGWWWWRQWQQAATAATKILVKLGLLFIFPPFFTLLRALIVFLLFFCLSGTPLAV